MTAQPEPQPEVPRCLNCGEPKELPEMPRGPLWWYELDPYCSRKCLEEFEQGAEHPVVFARGDIIRGHSVALDCEADWEVLEVNRNGRPVRARRADSAQPGETRYFPQASDWRKWRTPRPEEVNEPSNG
jgi:hypothetical protein